MVRVLTQVRADEVVLRYRPGRESIIEGAHVVRPGCSGWHVIGRAGQPGIVKSRIMPRLVGVERRGRARVAPVATGGHRLVPVLPSPVADLREDTRDAERPARTFYLARGVLPGGERHIVG